MSQDPKSGPDIPTSPAEGESGEPGSKFTRLAGHLLPRRGEGESPMLETGTVSRQIERYREQIGFADEDGAIVRELHLRLKAQLGAAFEALVDSAVSEKALSHFAVGDIDLDQLGYSLRSFFDWFESFDPQSRASVEERVDFYLRHRVLGLASNWYLTAYEIYLEAMSKEVINTGDTPEQRIRLLNSLHRLVLFDLGLVHQVYLYTRGRRGGDGDYAFPARRRQDFIDRLDSLLEKEPMQVGVIALMIDNLHQINSVMGHQIGDLVMQHVASRLTENLREEDFLQRTGASEFAILIPRLKGQQMALLAANKFVKVLNEPLHIGGRELHLSAAMGIAVVPDHGDDGAAAFQHAELAMREAARAQLDYLVFNRSLQERSRELYNLETELRRALSEGEELRLCFQPQFDLTTRRILGCEALLRWRNAKYGEVSPAKFIPIAEKSGLVQRLTAWVLQNVVRECANRWLGREGFKVSVNISALDLLDPDFPELVERTLSTWDVPPEYLLLEITESVMMEKPRAALKSLERLHRIGVRLSIDDFGTGHSSLMYLKQLPVNELKIDRSFVLNMNRDPGDEQIVRTVIDLAHNFGLDVIAEGVEDEETRDQLEALGCDHIQGYLIGRPMPADELDSLLNPETDSAARDLF
ncbi:MAG: hypothetical protein Kow006_21430 [Gammaproteobacteria bacterium]